MNRRSEAEGFGEFFFPCAVIFALRAENIFIYIFKWGSIQHGGGDLKPFYGK